MPTPTTPAGFDASVVGKTLALVGRNKIAIIKSTILPGITKKFQKQYPDLTIFYSPEFLSEATAAYDAAHPFSNIVGYPARDQAHEAGAALIHSVLPTAEFTLTCDSTEAELIKYSHNVSGYVQIVLFNMFYDLANKLGADWGKIQAALEADPFICNRYAKPVHKSGRGAGGGCFIKDFASFRSLYNEVIGDELGKNTLAALERKNLGLLKDSGKDKNLIHGVYGDL